MATPERYFVLADSAAAVAISESRCGGRRETEYGRGDDENKEQAAHGKTSNDLVDGIP
jgi:hypothetical protein